MSRYVSDQNKVVFISESGLYANTSGVGQWPGFVQEHDVGENMGVISVRFLGNAGRNVGQWVDGPQDYEGTLTLYPQDFRFLGFALGSIVDSGSPSPYIHTASETNNNQPNAYTSGVTNPFLSFTLEDSQTGNANGEHFVRTVKGCTVDNLSIKTAQGDPVTMEVGYRAQSVVFSSGTSTAVTAATTRPYLWNDLKVHMPSGTVFEDVKEMNLSINNSLEAPHYVNGSRVISTPIPLNRDYELSITLNATSERTKTLYDQYFLGGSQFNALLDFVLSAGSQTLLVTLSGCKITDMDAPSKLEGVNEQALTIKPTSVSTSEDSLVFKYNAW